MTTKACSSCGGGNNPPQTLQIPNDEAKTLDEAFERFSNTPRDLDKHLPKLRELASKVSHVSEISKRRESTVAFLAATPKFIRSYNSEPVPPNLIVMAIEKGTDFKFARPVDGYDKIDETDLLFIDNEHTYNRTKAYLEKLAPSVKRFIIFHDTIYHREQGEDGGPGLWPAIREYLTTHPEWSVIYHTKEEYGLTVIGRDKQDKPKLPNILKEAVNLTKAVAAYTASGFDDVSKEQYEERLGICSMCTFRVDERCSKCGCFLTNEAAKEHGIPKGRAVMRVMDCPENFWPIPTNEEAKP